MEHNNARATHASKACDASVYIYFHPFAAVKKVLNEENIEEQRRFYNKSPWAVLYCVENRSDGKM